MKTETIYGSRSFIGLDRNPNIPPASWPFRRLGVPALAAAAEGRDVKQARGVARQSGPDRGNAQ